MSQGLGDPRGVLERKHRGRRESDGHQGERRRALARSSGGWFEKRAHSPLPLRGAFKNDERSHLWGHLRSGAVSRHHPPHPQDQASQARGRGRVDEESPAFGESERGRRARGFEGRSRGSEEPQRTRGKERKEEKRQIQGEGKEKGLKKEREEEKEEQDPTEEKRSEGSRGDPRRKRVRSRSVQEGQAPEASKASCSKEEEEEGKLLRGWELERQPNRRRRQLSRDGALRSFRADPSGIEDLEEVPRGVVSNEPSSCSGTAVDLAGPTVGSGPQRAASPVSSILQGPAKQQDGPCNAPRGIAFGLCHRPGALGENPRNDRRADAEAEGTRRSNRREALERDQSVRAGPRGERSSCFPARNRAGSSRSQRSWQGQGPKQQGFWSVPRREQRRRLEERSEPRRSEQQRSRERQGLVEEWQAGKPRFQEGARRQGWEQSKVEKEDRVLEEEKQKGKVQRRGGEEPPKEGAKAGVVAPRMGAEEKMGEDPFQFDAAQTSPVEAAIFPKAEGRKCGLSLEYAPVSHNSSRVDFKEIAGRPFCAIGQLLLAMMDDRMFEQFLHSKSQPSGVGKDAIFPLPWSSDIVEKSRNPCMVKATCRGLNLLFGVPGDGKKEQVSAACLRALKFVIRCVDAVSSWDDVFQELSFDSFFKSKGVDYRGEEVKIAQGFSWLSISPAMPPEVGGVRLIDFCTLGTRFYVEHFEDFLVPPEKRCLGRPPKVMVKDEDWYEVVQGLVKARVCGIIPLDQVCHIDDKPLLGGLFGVGKNEFIGSLETQRLIMNFVPLNSNCRPLDSDISTLPGISGLSPFMLGEGEIALLSSEDIRCFFYLFSVPEGWYPYLGFNKLVPEELKPAEWKGRPCVLHAQVLPMGFRNSVGIAQHIHRNVIRAALDSATPAITGEKEMRKDRPNTVSKESFRIYLDNFDVISKVDPALKAQLEGKPGMLSMLARQAYADANLPRHPKKSVCQAAKAEVQGAIFDGEVGIAYPKPPKVLLYVSLCLELLRRGCCTQREMQVVCGGFVYFSLFRRPLLSALNRVWSFIESFKSHPPVIRLDIPLEVSVELVRFVSLVPLARMDFRLCCMGDVTASDASTTGGGACVSTGLTDFGVTASNASVRGDLPEQHDFSQVLTVGLFDGVGCLRMACDLLGLPIAGHISVEKDPSGRRVVEAAFADTIFVNDVELINEELVLEWVGRFSQVALILLGAGPPCQGVSGLNFDKRGALRDCRSCLFQHVPRVRDLFKRLFPWAQVRTLMESVASMDEEDKRIMSEAVGLVPYRIDASGMTLAHRPRLYWCDWELLDMQGVALEKEPQADFGTHHHVTLTAHLEPKDYLQPGWSLQSPDQRLPTFTTSRPSPQPGRRPAGLKQCQEHEAQRWAQDAHRFPPYQYKDSNCLVHQRTGELRIASLLEREVIMGMPAHYTTSCLAKAHRQEPNYTDTRLTLVGNAWSVPVVAWLIGCLGYILGLCSQFTPQAIVDAAKPGNAGELQRLLLRPPISRRSSVPSAQGVQLVKKLAGLVSIKGEDLLLHAASEPQVKYQRLRASLPSGLWRWKTIAGWTWQGSPEHINVLELRAVYTSIRWWASQRQAHSARLVHLTDSLVCLHALSRGRSSSRKMRRTMAKLNSYLLACNLHPVWAYVHTSENPADKPSRRRVKKSWVK